MSTHRVQRRYGFSSWTAAGGFCGVALVLLAVESANAAEGCLTATPGFWQNHPAITDQLLPMTSCGVTLDPNTREPEQDLCSNNAREAKANNTSTQQLQLEHQCAAANLNIAVTLASQGDCSTEVPNIVDTIDECCNAPDSVCRSSLSGSAITATDCIAELDAFNDSEDTMETPDELVEPGPADPADCKSTSRDGVLNPRPRGPK